MWRQGLKSIGALAGAVIAVTLLMDACLYLSPSSAQSPTDESGITVSPGRSSDSATERPFIVTDRPAVSLDFPFTDDLTDAAVKSQPEIAVLAKALASQELKGSTFVIACHTTASGDSAADQALSERCANMVRRVLVEKFGLTAETLVAVGYGSAKLKNPANPFSIENRRLEIANMNRK